MSRRRVWGIGLVVLAFALASVAIAAPPKDAIVVGLLAEPVTMDPPQITDLNSTRVIKRMFEGLTAQELGTYKIVPGLAQSWDISKDGLTYTFHLRPNVKFHDGTPVTAEAVKFCFDRQMNDQGPFYATGTYPYVKGFLGNVAGVEVVGRLGLDDLRVAAGLGDDDRRLVVVLDVRRDADDLQPGVLRRLDAALDA